MALFIYRTLLFNDAFNNILTVILASQIFVFKILKRIGKKELRWLTNEERSPNRWALYHWTTFQVYKNTI